jgi:peptidoglycan/xylan/chitin deacetylase (PgdA/CDA1 family)
MNPLKSLLRRGLYALGRAERGFAVRADDLTVLMLHGFTDREHQGTENCDHKHLHIKKFEEFLTVLMRQANVITLSQAVAGLTGQQPLPPRSIVLTCDDGFESNYRLAFPVLKRLGASASIFLATQFIDEQVPIWTDRVEYALAGRSGTEVLGVKRVIKKRRGEDVFAAVQVLEQETGRALGDRPHAERADIQRALTWDMVREMHQSGVVEIGAHTHHHLILGRCEEATVRAEVFRSRDIIESQLGAPCRHFCYPNGAEGDFNALTEQVVQEAGFQSALVTLIDKNAPGCNPFQIKRIGWSNAWDRAEFFLRVSGAIGSLREGRTVRLT